MIILPMTVLAYEGPIARAYLALLNRSGYKPRSILSLIIRKGGARKGGAMRAQVLPRSLVDAYRSRRDLDRNLHWPRWLRRQYGYLYREMVERVGAACVLSREIFDEALEGLALHNYSNDVSWITIDGLKDATLARSLNALDPGEILYTGGGIVPATLLADPGRPFLHVHPGFLPHVRGADGVLWSTLVRGQAGASCFHMTPGIDLGPVLAARELQPLVFSLPCSQRPDDAMLYRAIFSFYDPYLRASVLLDHLRSRPLAGYPGASVPQDPSVGVTYHFMHPMLRQRVLRKLFREVN